MANPKIGIAQNRVFNRYSKKEMTPIKGLGKKFNIGLRPPFFVNKMCLSTFQIQKEQADLLFFCNHSCFELL
jgi:hypothetical protein